MKYPALLALLFLLRTINSLPTSSEDTIAVSFYTSTSCSTGFIETRTVAAQQCFQLSNNIHFGSYIVTSTIPGSLLTQGLLLEAGDTYPVDCSAGHCVLLRDGLDCQPALEGGGTAGWFGMFWGGGRGNGKVGWLIKVDVVRESLSLLLILTEIK
jgi:hypothetical protein